MGKVIEGFSKLSKSEKIDWITKTHFKDPKLAKKRLEQYWNNNSELQKSHDEFIENTISNFYIPLGVAPNFLINEKIYSLYCDLDIWFLFFRRIFPAECFL